VYALIELPQESRHPFRSSIELYSIPANHKLQFISDQKCPVDSQHYLITPVWRLHGEYNGTGRPSVQSS